jgi:hypothetical protein
MIKNSIIIDNFLDNVDEVRNNALLLNYTKALKFGWKGYRCLDDNELAINLDLKIKDALVKTNTIFKECISRSYFHYTLEETNIGIGDIHKDDDFNYAGVLYLKPNPSEKSGTSFYNESMIEIDYFENIYNRLVIYPADQLHSVTNAFGDNINNGRLTFTFFCKLKEKNTKTII